MTGEEQYAGLNGRARRFVDGVVGGKKERVAYLEAGYTSSQASAPARLAAYYRKAIMWRRDQLSEGAADERRRSIERLTRYAEGSIADLVEVDGGEVVARDWADLPTEVKALVSEISQTPSGIRLKVESRLAAEKQLAALHGWNAPQKVELSNLDDVAELLGLNPEEIRGAE